MAEEILPEVKTIDNQAYW